MLYIIVTSVLAWHTVFREPLDNTVSLGKRSAALEDEFVGKRRAEKNIERPDYPNVLFEQMNGATGFRGGDAEGLAAIRRG